MIVWSEKGHLIWPGGETVKHESATPYKKHGFIRGNLIILQTLAGIDILPLPLPHHTHRHHHHHHGGILPRSRRARTNYLHIYCIIGTVPG